MVLDDANLEGLRVSRAWRLSSPYAVAVHARMIEVRMWLCMVNEFSEISENTGV